MKSKAASKVAANAALNAKSKAIPMKSTKKRKASRAHSPTTQTKKNETKTKVEKQLTIKRVSLPKTQNEKGNESALSRNLANIRNVQSAVSLNLTKVRPNAADLFSITDSNESRGLTRNMRIENNVAKTMEELRNSTKIRKEAQIETYSKIKSLERNLISTDQICQRLVVPFNERCPKLKQDETCYVSVIANQPSLLKVPLDGLTSPLKLKVDYSLNQDLENINMTIFTSLTEQVPGSQAKNYD